MGDTVTLTGKNFQPPGGSSEVVVHFGPVPLPVVPSSDTSVTATVPVGAPSGSISVTTTITEGAQTVSQTSNALDILVIWKHFDSAVLPGIPLWAQGNAYQRLFSGADQNIYVARSYSNSVGGQMRTLVYKIYHDGTARVVQDIPTIYPFAVNPLNDNLAYLTWGGGYPYFVESQTGRGCRVDTANDAYFPHAGAYDQDGNLLVAAIGRGPDGFWRRSALWRFAPSDPISFDPAIPQCLTPGGVPYPTGWGWGNRYPLASSKDGTIYWTVNGVQENGSGDGTTVGLRFSPGVSSYEVFPLPSDPNPVGFEMTWSMAADCMDRVYLMSTLFSQFPSTGTLPIRALPGGQTVATSRPSIYPFGIGSDGYGNLYVMSRLSRGAFTIDRVLPSEFADPHYYDTFDCCAARSASRMTGETGAPLDVGIKPLTCDIPGTLKIKLTPEPGDPISGDLGDLNTFTWITPGADGKADASVLFGQAPKLEAVWQDHPGGTETSEQVLWEVVPGSETAPGADPKGLYPTKPELLFTGGAAPYTNSALQFQTVHLGTFVLKATTENAQHKGPNGQPAFIEVTVTVASPAGLLDLENVFNSYQYDALIIQHADKYGIPPQYIKSQVYEESAFKPNAYRYEPLSYDMMIVSPWSSAQWALNNYDSFKLPSGAELTPADFDNRDTLTHIVASDFKVQPPVLPYTCDTYHYPSDGHAFFFDMFVAEDGWLPGSYPWTLFNHARGPCGIRQRWSENHNTPVAWHNHVFYCGSTQTTVCSSAQQGFITWLLDNKDYEAQTAICASYGLMQPMYTTAVQDMQWRKGEPAANRDPVLLFDPPTALDLGVGYDSIKIKEKAFGSDASHMWGALFDYQQALVTGFLYYNKYGEKYIRGLHITQGYLFRPF